MKASQKLSLSGQAIIYISLIVMTVCRFVGKELPDWAFIVMCILDLLTVPVCIYSYVKSLDEKKGK